MTSTAESGAAGKDPAGVCDRRKPHPPPETRIAA